MCLHFYYCYLWKLLSENKHVKYLYIPYTDSVVVVRCNPVSKWKGPPKFKPHIPKMKPYSMCVTFTGSPQEIWVQLYFVC
ncbi:hypothetical protein AAZX31_10G099300 [Glycine max]